jgi:hypothetical protein
MTTVAIECSARPTREFPPEHAVAQAELHASSYTALRHVCCCVSDGRIVLCGTVPSYYLKQMAQCLMFKRLGDQFQVDNRLEVASRATESRPARE